MVIFFSETYHFCLYLLEALINLLKHGNKIKTLLNKTTWLLFNVNR